MNNEKKVFAFKLSEKNEKKEKAANARWKVRDGVSLAGCTDPIGNGSYREDDWFWGAEQGFWC
jgi:hypothetical protein